MDKRPLGIGVKLHVQGRYLGYLKKKLKTDRQKKKFFGLIKDLLKNENNRITVAEVEKSNSPRTGGEWGCDYTVSHIGKNDKGRLEMIANRLAVKQKKLLFNVFWTMDPKYASDAGNAVIGDILNAINDWWKLYKFIITETK